MMGNERRRRAAASLGSLGAAAVLMQCMSATEPATTTTPGGLASLLWEAAAAAQQSPSQHVGMRVVCWGLRQSDPDCVPSVAGHIIRNTSLFYFGACARPADERWTLRDPASCALPHEEMYTRMKTPTCD